MGFKIALLLSVLVTCILAGKPIFKDLYGKIDANIKVGDAGEPLIITDYLKEDRIQEAQAAAEVDSTLFAGVKSYSGYFRVNEATNASLFFWFFPAESNYTEAPIILWLHGGPATSSMFGLFQQTGPIQLVGDHKLETRNTSWTKFTSVLYIDQPAGTGFSFTNGETVRNQTQVGAEIYVALQQFFQLFPDQQPNDFFITGENYAGKYVPAISYTILKNNPNADLKINLQGLAIGNGWSSPIHQLRHAEYFYQHGLIDSTVRDYMSNTEQEAVRYINEGKFDKALSRINFDLGDLDSTFSIQTGFSNAKNYLYEYSDTTADIWLGNFLQREDVRKAIHVGNTPFGDGSNVYETLKEDIPQSIAPWIEELLENYRVLIYNGQLDLIVPYPLTIDYLKSLNFSGADDFNTTIRFRWFVEDRIAGFFKTAGNLTEILVRNAGHKVTLDQPEWALDMITRFVNNIGFW